MVDILALILCINVQVCAWPWSSLDQRLHFDAGIEENVGCRTLQTFHQGSKSHIAAENFVTILGWWLLNVVLRGARIT